MLDELLVEIERLKRAHEILDLIWMECNPYIGGQISKEALSKMRDYFKFDDSE